MVSLAEDVRQKLYFGRALDDHEARSVSRSIESIVGIVGKIPRLEPAIQVLKTLSRDASANDAVESRVVRAAILIESCESRDLDEQETLQAIEARSDELGADVVAACGKAEQAGDEVETTVISVAPAALADGMILVNDLLTSNGVLLAPRGMMINSSTLEHILNFTDRLDGGGIEVRVVASHATSAAQATG